MGFEERLSRAREEDITIERLYDNFSSGLGSCKDIKWLYDVKNKISIYKAQKYVSKYVAGGLAALTVAGNYFYWDVRRLSNVPAEKILTTDIFVGLAVPALTIGIYFVLRHSVKNAEKKIIKEIEGEKLNKDDFEKRMKIIEKTEIITPDFLLVEKQLPTC